MPFVGDAATNRDIWPMRATSVGPSVVMRSIRARGQPAAHRIRERDHAERPGTRRRTPR